MKLDDLGSMRDQAIDYQALRFEPTHHADQDAATPVRHSVVIVGAGPVGLALAIDLAQRGLPVVLLDNDNTLSTGSRAICFAKRTLEIFDRLGCGDRMVAKGVSWNVGRVFLREQQLYSFDLLPNELSERADERPAFINLQQYYVEGFLAERVAELPLIDLRWQHAVVGVAQHADHAVLSVDTPAGPYSLKADHVVACDGGRSAVRRLIGQESVGRTFKDRFLIADVKMKREQPAERWFWFDPSFHPNQSVLLHMQPDGVWRIDFQLGWDANPEFEKRPENIIPRVRALLGEGAEFDLEWASVYTFSCLRMAHFRHGRVLFAGDSAHGVSPFGARGANSGVQDADNLGWKLALVAEGRAPDGLLGSYADEREFAADENIRASTRATDFITPKSEASRLFRDAVLQLAKRHPFARTLVNSGRLSVPAVLIASPLNTPDVDVFAGRMQPGAAAADAPVQRADGKPDWLLRMLAGGNFTALVLLDRAELDPSSALRDAAAGIAPLSIIRIAPRDTVTGLEAVDTQGIVAARYDMQPGTVILLRPDQHVCARWRAPSAALFKAALQRALAIH